MKRRIKRKHRTTNPKKMTKAQLLRLLRKAMKLAASLERQVDTVTKQMRDTVRVNGHNAGSHRASEVAFLRLNREAEELRNQNRQLRDSKLKELPPAISVTRDPTQFPEDYKAPADDTKVPLPALYIPPRIDVTQPLEKQLLQLNVTIPREKVLAELR
jgi:hypothetical protein